MRAPFSIIALFLFGSVAYAEVMYVKSPTAELKSSTGASATVLTQLNRGTALTVVSKTGNWVEGTAAGKKGFVYKFKLSATKPSGGDNVLASLGGGGASAREGSTAASIRGLSPTSEKYAGRAKIGPAQIDMVKHMEALRVAPQDVQAFLKAGKLGEYAEMTP